MMKRQSNKTLLLLFLITLIATSLRIHNLSAKSMWFDEIYSLRFASHSPTEILLLLVKDDAPPLYPLILHYWMMLGSDPYALRFLSAFFGVLMVALVYVLGTSLFDSDVGLLGSALSSVSLLLVQESQTVRPYTIYGFFTLASLYFFYNGLTTKNKTTYWVGYILSTLICIYLHYFGFLILFSEVVFFLIYWKRHAPARTYYIMSILLVLLLYAPWIQMFIEHSEPVWHEKNINFTYTFRVITERLVIIYRTLAFMSNLNYLIPVFLVLIACSIYGRASDTCMNYKLSMFLVVAVISFASIFIVRTFHTKFVIYMVPLYYILAAKGFCSLPSRKIKHLLVMALLSGSIMALSGYYDSEIADWRSVAEYIRFNAGDDDLILVEPSSERLSLMYYLPDAEHQFFSLTESDGTPSKTRKVFSDYPGKNIWVVYTAQNLMKYDLEGKLTRFLEEQKVNKTEFTWITVYQINN